MRIAKTRLSDSTFEINLAPFLDIVVSVVPLLLLSVVFVEIKMIETPIPQVVQEAIEKDQKNPTPEVTLQLKVDKEKGFTFIITYPDKKESELINIPTSHGEFDFAELNRKSSGLKSKHPKIFKLGLLPEENVPLKIIIKVMDTVRRQTDGGRKIAFVEPDSGQKVETDLLFPNVTFSNVVEE
ncbi:MAG: biopolymer transporter ExbD [Bdellovibrionales bacterium]|nr:biopolymer transporter ExbD [Bdellovibrionales bacterium]